MVGFGYDAGGNLTSVTPPGRSAHTLAYNSVDLGSGYTPPGPNGGQRAVTASYNSDRQVTQLALPDSQSVSFGYDAAGRSSTITLPTGTLQSGYDPSAGTLLTLTSPGGITLTYSYDGLLPAGVEWSGPITGSVEYAYNDDFAPAEVSVNGTTLAGFDYDNDGLLTTAGLLDIARANQTGLIVGTAVGGVTTSLSHNGFGELTGQTASYGGNTLYQAEYTRDNGGRIRGLTETVRGVTTTWDYDSYASGRLFRVVRDSADTTVYSYDSNGNRIQVVSPLGTVTGTYDGEDRLQTYGGADYTYNNAGQLIEKDAGGQVTSYVYDVPGNLTGVTLPDSTQIAYLVDGQGRRIGKKVNGVLVQGWLWQGQLAPVAELDSTGAVVSRFVYGTRVNVPDYMERGGETYRLITNHLGSVQLVVNAGTGQVVSWRDYDEWGRVVADSNPDFQPFGFAGGLDDSGIGFVRLGAREYEPATGRFVTKDGLVFAAGQTNLYPYAAGDPVNLVDPSGNTPWSALGGALLGGIVNATYVASRTGATWQQAALAFGVGSVAGFVGGLIPIPGVSGAISGALARFGNHLLIDDQIESFCRTGFNDAQLRRELLLAALTGGVFGGVGRLAGTGMAGLQQSLSNFVPPISETVGSILGADVIIPLIQEVFPGRGGQ